MSNFEKSSKPDKNGFREVRACQRHFCQLIFCQPLFSKLFWDKTYFVVPVSTCIIQKRYIVKIRYLILSLCQNLIRLVTVLDTSRVAGLPGTVLAIDSLLKATTPIYTPGNT